MGEYLAAGLPGWVYLFHSPSRHYKIGWSYDIPQRRTQIARLVGEPVAVIHQISTNDTYRGERMVHARFGNRRLDGEWFDLTDDDVRAFCEMDEIRFHVTVRNPDAHDELTVREVAAMLTVTPGRVRQLMRAKRITFRMEGALALITRISVVDFIAAGQGKRLGRRPNFVVAMEPPNA